MLERNRHQDLRAVVRKRAQGRPVNPNPRHTAKGSVMIALVERILDVEDAVFEGSVVRKHLDTNTYPQLLRSRRAVQRGPAESENVTRCTVVCVRGDCWQGAERRKWYSERGGEDTRGGVEEGYPKTTSMFKRLQRSLV